jgi:two-component system nitrogen regulation response regulator GlnG
MAIENRTVWVVDDDSSISWVLEKALTRANFQVKLFPNAEAALSGLDDNGNARPGALLSDIRMGGMSGFDLIEKLEQKAPGIPVIIMTAFGDLDSAVDAYKYGAFEYLTKPFDIKDMVSLVERATRQSTDLSAATRPSVGGRKMLGESAAMQEVFRIIGRLSSSQMNILIRGESGTGKELVAEAIYRNSPRAQQPLVAINTAAIPAELLESELFGHEKGAFTGAYDRHIGRFEQADGGTLFLDEIGDMPPNLQTRLLRVLSEGRFYRVGGRQEVRVSVRVIAATNQNLESLVASGAFRNDLFHRLNVISVNTPSLRQRKVDIPVLISHFLARAAIEIGAEPKLCAPETVVALQQYSWPGNIRELENLVRRLSVLAPSNTIQLADLPVEITNQGKIDDSWETTLALTVAEKLQCGEKRLLQSFSAKFESVLIRAAMEHTRGHKQNAAELLGLGRNTLARKLKQWK